MFFMRSTPYISHLYRGDVNFINSNKINDELTKNRKPNAYARGMTFIYENLPEDHTLFYKQKVEDLKNQIKKLQSDIKQLSGRDTLTLETKKEMSKQYEDLQFALSKASEDLKNARLEKAQNIKTLQINTPRNRESRYVNFEELYPSEYTKTPVLSSRKITGYNPSFYNKTPKESIAIGTKSTTKSTVIEALNEIKASSEDVYKIIIKELGKFTTQFNDCDPNSKAFEILTQDLRDVYVYNYEPSTRIGAEITKRIDAKIEPSQNIRS